MSLLSQLEDIQASLSMHANLASFVKGAWHVFETSTPLVWNWHHEAMCAHLQALYTGDIHKLIIAVPPRHTKSSIVNVSFPAWVWIRQPHVRFLCASYALSLALRDAQRCRDLIDSAWYQDQFGSSFSWLPDQNSKSRYETDKHGYRIATSVEGAATGEGGEYIIIDDPHNIQAGESTLIRQATLDWFDRVMVSRLNDQQTGRICVVAQRVHENDLIGHLLETGDWEYLCLPAEFESNKRTCTSIGWSDPRTDDGEPLWEVKFPKAVLRNLRKTLVVHYFSQYQQRPTAEEGAILKSHMFWRYSLEDDSYILYQGGEKKRIPKSHCRTVISTDLALSKTTSADYTVFLIWAVTPDLEFLLLDITREKMEAPESEELLYATAASAYRLWCVIIEDVAYQKSVIQRLRKPPKQRALVQVNEDGTPAPPVPVRKSIPVQAYHPVHDKVARTQDIAVYFSAGNFYFNTNVAGFAEYKKELTAFPRGAKDDQVDATTIIQALFQYGSPRITRLEDINEEEELEFIRQIAQEDKELAEFLLEDYESYDYHMYDVLPDDESEMGMLIRS